MLEVTPQKGQGKGSTDREDVGAKIREVFEEQRARRWEVATTTAGERIARLGRLRDAIRRRQSELHAAMREDFRKPAAEVDLTELQPVLFEIAHAVKHLRSWMKPVQVGAPPTLIGTQSMLRYEPKGCVLILSPWNYPFNLMLSPLVAAIAAGNTVMARPSDKVPRTSHLMASLVEEVFPRHEVAMFTGPSSIANTMLDLPFDHMLFTGSTRIGRQVMAAAAGHLASVTLELGGQSPVVVDESADVEAAAKRIVWGKYLNGGQTCVAPNHVFVHESVATRFVEAARRAIEHAYGPTEEARRKSEDFCRIVDKATARKLVELIDRSVAAGAKLEIGGVSDVEERYLAPTILSGVTDGSPIMEAEIFGPIMPVLPYRAVDDVLASIRRRGKPLAMYIFSTNRDAIDRLVAGTSAGGTVINNVIIHLANPELPFGGVGESGMGSYHGIHGFKAFSHERAVMLQGRPALARLFYPPYVPRVRRGIDLLTRLLG
jgi:aldehyde dehydrogenase (NAD+)